MNRLSIEYIEANSMPCPATGCWLWTGELNQDGYGVFKVHIGEGKRKNYKAYRVALGIFERGVYVLHRCDVRACVNPAHLYVGSHKQNMADMAARGRRVSHGKGGRPKQENCRKGHPLSGDNLLGASRQCKTCRKAWKLARYGNVRR